MNLNHLDNLNKVLNRIKKSKASPTETIDHQEIVKKTSQRRLKRVLKMRVKSIRPKKL